MRKSNMSCHTRRARAPRVFDEVAMAEQYALKPDRSIAVMVDAGRYLI
jgi:hypothetical protein